MYRDGAVNRPGIQVVSATPDEWGLSVLCDLKGSLHELTAFLSPKTSEVKVPSFPMILLILRTVKVNLLS